MSAPQIDAILPAVLAIVARVTRREQVAAGMATLLEDIDGMDSLRLLETVALAEEQFGVEVETGGLGQIATLGDIVRMIAQACPG